MIVWEYGKCLASQWLLTSPLACKQRTRVTEFILHSKKSECPVAWDRWHVEESFGILVERLYSQEEFCHLRGLAYDIRRQTNILLAVFNQICADFSRNHEVTLGSFSQKNRLVSFLTMQNKI